jgi:transcriptional regulator with XRE-family HTH domain
MLNKATGDLNNDLIKAENIDSYISTNREFFMEQDVPKLLAELYEKKSMSKADLARRSGVSVVYLHQVFAGRRKPSRDRLLCLCIGLEASLEETQRLLMQSTYAQLYSKIKRDAIISFGLVHHMDVQEINDKLFDENEQILF